MVWILSTSIYFTIHIVISLGIYHKTSGDLILDTWAIVLHVQSVNQNFMWQSPYILSFEDNNKQNNSETIKNKPGWG